MNLLKSVWVLLIFLMPVHNVLAMDKHLSTINTQNSILGQVENKSYLQAQFHRHHFNNLSSYDDLDLFGIEYYQKSGSREARVAPSFFSASSCIESLCLPESYDRLQRPSSDDGGPIRVGVFLRQLRVVSIDDDDFTMTFEVNLGLMWREARIVDNEHTADSLVAVDTKLVSQLWVPELYVRDLKYRSRTLSDLDGRLFVLNKKDILYQQQLIMSVWCPFRYEFYPLDTQNCNISMGGFAYDNSILIFELRALDYDKVSAENPVLDHIRIKPIFDTDYYDNDEENFRNNKKGRGGRKLSRVGVAISLKRRPFQFVVNYYLPATLFVVVSWVTKHNLASFLIPPSLIPGRMILLVTLFLVLINIFNTLNEKSPRVEGITMINLYVITCILFVFGALAGYALILRRKRRSDIRNNRVAHVGTMTDSHFSNTIGSNDTLFVQDLEELANNAQENSSERGTQNGHIAIINTQRTINNGAVVNNLMESNKSSVWHERDYDRSDTALLIAFPLLFLAFNSVYWPLLINYKNIFG